MTMQYNTQLALRLPKDLWDLLTRKSLELERSKSWLIRDALRSRFRADEKKEKRK